MDDRHWPWGPLRIPVDGVGNICRTGIAPIKILGSGINNVLGTAGAGAGIRNLVGFIEAAGQQGERLILPVIRDGDVELICAVCIFAQALAAYGIGLVKQVVLPLSLIHI